MSQSSAVTYQVSGLISRTLAENSELAKTVRVLFPDDVGDAGNWNRFGDIGVHLLEGSWRTPSGYLPRRLAKCWESTKTQRVLKQSLRLGKTRNQATAITQVGGVAPKRRTNPEWYGQ